jgi:hypothetical protein
MAAAEAQVVRDRNTAAGGRPLFCLEFVSMNASSQAEKQQNQKVIRSTAMKNFRRLQQMERTRAKEASKTNSELRPHQLPKLTKEKEKNNKEDSRGHKEQRNDIKEESNQDLQDESSQAADDWIFETSSHASWLEGQAASGNHKGGLWNSEAMQADGSLSRATLNSLLTLNSPLNILGGGRVDPFRTYPAGYGGPHVHELIDHCELQPQLPLRYTLSSIRNLM